jgi:hypothetical protein
MLKDKRRVMRSFGLLAVPALFAAVLSGGTAQADEGGAEFASQPQATVMADIGNKNADFQSGTAARAVVAAPTQAPASAPTGEGDAGAPTVMADRSCTVTNRWSCVTAPLWVNGGANPHLATLNIPWTAPYKPELEWDPVNSFVIVRNLDAAGDPEILRDNKWHGAEHNIWSVGWPAGNYRAELHCPYSCQGATLYFDN